MKSETQKPGVCYITVLVLTFHCRHSHTRLLHDLTITVTYIKRAIILPFHLSQALH